MKSPGKSVLSEITAAGPVAARITAPLPQMMAGSVRSFGDQLQHEVAEAKEIREQIANGELVVELDPGILDVSFVSDRIDNDEDEAFLRSRRKHPKFRAAAAHSCPACGDRWPISNSFWASKGPCCASPRDKGQGYRSTNFRRTTDYRSGSGKQCAQRSFVYRKGAVRVAPRKCWRKARCHNCRNGSIEIPFVGSLGNRTSNHP